MSINNKGDTIVEVLLATTVLSAILFTSWSIVNRASQISMAARQRVYMVEVAMILALAWRHPTART